MIRRDVTRRGVSKRCSDELYLRPKARVKPNEEMGRHALDKNQPVGVMQTV